MTVQARQLVFPSPMTVRERLAAEITAQLNAAGVGVYPPVFPFGLHHDYYRTRIVVDGRHARRSEVAGLLRRWAEGRDDGDYVWQAVCGGLLRHFAPRMPPPERLPGEVLARLEILGWGSDFLGWCRSAGH